MREKYHDELAEALGLAVAVGGMFIAICAGLAIFFVILYIAGVPL